MRERQIIWLECKECDGTGMVHSVLEEVQVTCWNCGGHKQIPSGDGSQTYFRSNGKGLQHVAVLHRALEDESKWRVTVYCQSGPFTHKVRSAEKVMAELERFLESDTAAKLLDYWSTKPRWEQGIKRAYICATANALPSKLASQLWQTEDVDEAEALATKLRREHAPDVTIW